ncbi:UNVERIFIED_ORG: tetratricopeptide (TPR) repeat protein [Rhizobium aethiopicum]
MNAEVHDLKACEVSADEARAELERLFSDTRFRVTERQKDILRYLAERRFNGCDDGAKAYSVALDVLGRPSDFDASTDPIVRIEISRLRSALDAYYQAFGAAGSVTIHIPKGMYIALFSGMPIPHEFHGGLEAAVESRQFPPVSDAAPVPVRPRHGYRIAAAATAVALILAAVAGFELFSRSPAMTTKPTVYIMMEAAEGRLQGEASQTRDALTTALTQFTTLTVAKAGYANVRSGAPIGRSYEIDIKYYGDADDRSVWWQIADSNTGDVLKSGLEKVDISGKSPAFVREEMAGELAQRFAATRGVINNIEIHDGPDDALGNACVLRAEYALDDGGLDRVLGSRDCLERGLAIAPGDPDTNALLSRVLLVGKNVSIDPAVQLRALALAKGAVSAAPMSDRAQVALMVAQFAAGRVEAAVQAGNRAVELNPNNGDAAAKLALVLYLAGYKDAGVAMVHDAGRAVDVAPRDAILVLALDAYSSGRYSEASLLSEQISCTDFMVATLRVAAFGQLGSPEAHERLSEITAKDPDFERTFRDRVAAWRLQPDIATQLEVGLIKAGAQVDKNAVASVTTP